MYSHEHSLHVGGRWSNCQGVARETASNRERQAAAEHREHTCYLSRRSVLSIHHIGTLARGLRERTGKQLSNRLS